MKTRLILDINKTQYAQLNSLVTGRVGDKDINTVDVYVVDGFIPYNLTGSDVYFECAKPDNTSVRDKNGITMIDAAKGHFEYTFPAQTFASVGKSKQAYFTVEKNSTVKATTQDFIIVSLPDALTNRIPSKTYISQLDQLIRDLEAIQLDVLNSVAYQEAHDAKTFAEQAKSISESVQEQLNQIVINGDSSVEAAQARVDENGESFNTLKERIDKGFINNTSQIEILSNIAYNVRTYGAKLDGVTDDTISIQNTINELSKIGGGKVLIPFTNEGCAIKSGEIVIPSNIIVEGQNTKIIINSVNTVRNVFKTDKTKVNKNINFKGLHFYSKNDKTRSNGRGQLGSNVNAIVLSNVENIKLEKLTFENCEFGLKIDTYGKQIHFDNLSFNGTYQPFYVSNTDVITGRTFYSDRLGMNSGFDHHIYINSATTNLTISDIKMIGSNSYAIDVKDDTGNAPPKNIIFTDIVLNSGGGLIVSEQKADVTISNVIVTIDKTLTSKNIFASIEDGKLKVSNFSVSGGGTLISGLNSPNGIIILINGIVDRLSTRVVVANSLGYAKLDKVTFLDVISEEGVAIFNHTGCWVTLLEFYDCHLTLISPKTNDPISHRANNTRYFNCTFDIKTQTPLPYVSYTYEQARSMFKNCIVSGNFTTFEWVNSNGNVVFLDCVDERDNSIFNTKSAIKKLYGVGSPEGVITAKVGSEYIRSDGSRGSTYYIKESGTGSTGWIAK